MYVHSHSLSLLMDANNGDNTIIRYYYYNHHCHYTYVCVREDSVGQFPQYMIYMYIHSLARLGFSVPNWVEFPDQATAQVRYWISKPQWIGFDLVFIKH